MKTIKILVTDFLGWSRLEYMWLIFALGFVITMSLILQSGLLSLLSAIANVLCVILVARGRISNYFWGAIGVSLYGYFAYQEYYYGNMLLNWLYYLPLQFIGFFLWHKHMTNQDSVIKKYFRWRTRLILILFLALAVFLLAIELAKHHDAMPYADAFTTTASIFAMLMMVGRYAEQWILWVSSNIISLYMWVVPTLHHAPGAAATLSMWVIFLINSIYGLGMWFTSSKTQGLAKSAP